MINCVLKFYRRSPGKGASQVVDRAFFEASSKEAAIARARELFDGRDNADTFAMLFVVDGDVMWISEPANG
jgi:hypothetical protein